MSKRRPPSFQVLGKTYRYLSESGENPPYVPQKKELEQDYPDSSSDSYRPRKKRQRKLQDKMNTVREVIRRA